jgi:hypothetical protein
MKTWIVSSLYEETIQGEETTQGRKLYEKIRYLFFIVSCIQDAVSDFIVAPVI